MIDHLAMTKNQNWSPIAMMKTKQNGDGFDMNGSSYWNNNNKKMQIWYDKFLQWLDF